MNEVQFKKLFGDRIRELRKYKNYTQEQFSELLSLDPQYFCKMENGKHFPSPKNIIKIAKILDVSVEDLFSFKSSSKNDNKSKLIRELEYNISNSLSIKELTFFLEILNSFIKMRKNKQCI